MHKPFSRRLHQRKQLEGILRVGRWEPAGESGAHEMYEVEGLDISSGGVGIVAAHSFRVGEVVKLEYDLNGGGITLPVYSEVVWCRADGTATRAGLRFLN
jgi:hypothetical protein